MLVARIISRQPIDRTRLVIMTMVGVEQRMAAVAAGMEVVAVAVAMLLLRGVPVVGGDNLLFQLLVMAIMVGQWYETIIELPPTAVAAESIKLIQIIMSRVAEEVEDHEKIMMHPTNQHGTNIKTGVHPTATMQQPENSTMSTESAATVKSKIKRLRMWMIKIEMPAATPTAAPTMAINDRRRTTTTRRPNPAPNQYIIHPTPLLWTVTIATPSMILPLYVANYASYLRRMDHPS